MNRNTGISQNETPDPIHSDSPLRRASGNHYVNEVDALNDYNLAKFQITSELEALYQGTDANGAPVDAGNGGQGATA